MDAPIGPRSFRQSFEAFWSKFRTTFYFRLLILLLVSVLAVLLLQSPIFCLSIVLIPAMVLLIPLWFGEKSVKNHAVNGILVLLLGTLLYAAILTPNFVSLPQQAQAYALDPAGQPARASLSEGMVTPFQGSSETNFTFTVKVKSTDANASEFKVRLQVASGAERSPFGRQEDAPNGVVVGGLLGGIDEFFDQRNRQRIQGLGTIECDPPDAAVVLDLEVFVCGHACPQRSITRSVRS